MPNSDELMVHTLKALISTFTSQNLQFLKIYRVSHFGVDRLLIMGDAEATLDECRFARWLERLQKSLEVG